MLERDSAAVGRGATRRSGCCAAGCAPERGRRRPCGAPARGSCTRTTCSRRSAGARSPRRARRARGSCCTCTTTGSCARSARASRAARTARAATAATRCPGVRLNCRGGSRAESAAYAAGLALWQRRLAGAADAIVVPSAFALDRLRELGAPRRRRARARLGPARVRRRARARGEGEYVLAAGRLTPEKGFADAIDACAQRGPAAGRRRRRARSWPSCSARAAGGDVRFTGHVSPAELAAAARRGRRRGRARRATPRSSRSRRWRRWPPGCRSSPPAPAGSSRPCRRRACTRRATSTRSAERLTALYGDAPAGERALAAARERWAPEVIAAGLRAIYDRNFAPAAVLATHDAPTRPPARCCIARPDPRDRPRRRHQEGDLRPRRDRRRSRSSRSTRTSAPAST